MWRIVLGFLVGVALKSRANARARLRKLRSPHSAIRGLAERTPRLLSLYRRIKYFNLSREPFQTIHDENVWGSAETACGEGSTLHETRAIQQALPEIVSDLRVSTLLDVPCGDLRWMAHVELPGVSYIGADIVPDLVATNAERFPDREFILLDLRTDPLPQVDLILTRDCLVHFSLADIWSALATVAASGARFFLTTTYVGRRRNIDIATGLWRPLNMEIAPFNLPSPSRCIIEGSTEGDGAFADKALATWTVEQIADAVAARRSRS